MDSTNLPASGYMCCIDASCCPCVVSPFDETESKADAASCPRPGSNTKMYVSPFGPQSSSKKRRKGRDAPEDLTEMEKAAMESAPKKAKKDGNYTPKRNVRKGKTRKR